jgi:HK97 family phage prohead protease
MNPKFKIFAPMLKTSMGTDGKMRLHGIASSTVKDRHGDTMTSSALADMEQSASANMTIFLNHSYEVPEDVAGSVERAIIRSHPQDPNIHDLALDIVINSANDRAVKAWEAINNGTQLGLSIGAMIPDGGATRDRKTGSYEINHVELLETSLVGVPANPRSWVEYAVKSLNGGTFLGEDEELDDSENEVADAVMAEKLEKEVDADTVETFETEEPVPDVPDVPKTGTL